MRLGGSASNLSSEQKQQKQQLQLLQIETMAASLTSPGAQSQYRCLASINMQLTNVIESFDEFLLALSSPEDPIYQSLAPIRDQISGAATSAEDRIQLIFCANSR